MPGPVGDPKKPCGYCKRPKDDHTPNCRIGQRAGGSATRAPGPKPKAAARNGQPSTGAATRAVLVALADKLERDADAMKAEAATIRRVAEGRGA